MPVRCPHCGNMISEEDRFCPFYDEQVNDDSDDFDPSDFDDIEEEDYQSDPYDFEDEDNWPDDFFLD